MPPTRRSGSWPWPPAGRLPPTPAPDEPGATAERDERLDPGDLGVLPRRAGDDPELLPHRRHRCCAIRRSPWSRRLPATFAALADGELDWPRARAIAGELGWKARDTPPAVVAAVEAAVLPVARSLSVAGASGGGAAGAAVPGLPGRRRPPRPGRTGSRCRGARPLPDGMGELRLIGPWPVITAMRDTVDGYARLARDAGDSRPLGQLRVGVFTDLTLRPWDTTRPPVTAHLTVARPDPGAAADRHRGRGGGADRRGGRRTDHRRRAARPAGGPGRAVPGRAAEPDRRQPAPRPHRPAHRSPAGRGHPAGNWNGSPPAAAPTIPPATAPAHSWKHHRRSRGIGPRPGSAGSPAPGTAPAGILAAATGPSGPTSTTSSPTPRAAPPTARISAASAGGITG